MPAIVKPCLIHLVNNHFGTTSAVWCRRKSWSEGALNYYATIKSIEKVLKLGFMFGSIQKICNDSSFHRLSLTWISKKFSETKIQLMKQCNHSVAQLSSSLSWQTDGLITDSIDKICIVLMLASAGLLLKERINKVWVVFDLVLSLIVESHCWL